jgi:hypothetical protein
VAVAWIDQLLPSQRSANVGDENAPDPTAVHAVLEVHDTPFSWLPSKLGLGVLWIVQLVPFQTSANALPENPTASQAVADVHDTPFS